MRTIIFVFLFVCPPFLKPWILRWFCRATIGHHVQIGWCTAIMGRHIEIGNHTEVRSLTVIRCTGDVTIGAYSVVSHFVLVYGLGGLRIGNHSYLGPQCLINADEDVHIGNSSALGPRCMIFTHGSFLPYTEGYWVKFAGVTIGDHVWIATGVFIHPGVQVGNKVFVNSRSVLMHDVPAGQVVNGFPAKPVAQMENLTRHMTPQRVDAAARQMLNHFAEAFLRRRLGVEVTNAPGDGLRFQYRRWNYHLLCIPSDGCVPPTNAMHPDNRLIFLVNRPHWSPPARVKNAAVFDLTTMRAQLPRDRLALELWRFMRMYFGVTFEHQ